MSQETKVSVRIWCFHQGKILKSVRAVQGQEYLYIKKHVVPETYGLKGENVITSFYSNYLWGSDLVPGAMGEVINVTKEPPGFQECSQVETG